MNYDDLEVYTGSKTRCDNCNREFKSGEVISLTTNGILVFCYSDAFGGCVSAYVFSTGKMLIGYPARYGTSIIPSELQTPHYPNSPVVQPPAWKKLSLWQRLRDYLSRQSR